MTLASVGGILGILMMVPLRRALIVKEHGLLPYPEGSACAEVLIAGERGGEMAKTVFAGFWTALFYALANKLFALWREVPRLIATGSAGAYKNATLTSEITPEYLGVGYIIGPRISGIMVSGSVLSWLALIPLLSMLVPEETIKADLLKLGFTQGWMDAEQPRQLDLSRVRPLHRCRRRGDGWSDDADADAARRSTRRSAIRCASCAEVLGPAVNCERNGTFRLPTSRSAPWVSPC